MVYYVDISLMNMYSQTLCLKTEVFPLLCLYILKIDDTANPFNYVELKKEPGRKSRVYYCTGIYKYVTMHVQCKLILCTATCIC